MRVLVTGASGLVGGVIAHFLSSFHDVTCGRHAAPTPPGIASVPLDLLAPSSIEAAFDAARPDAVLHCAALADPDRCEREPAAAAALNVRACERLARTCRARGTRLVALSTDLVFDGTRARVTEDEPPRPLIHYGRTKLQGEDAVIAEAPGSVVLRVALVTGRGFGPRATATEALAWALRAGRRLRLFTDQHRTPVDTASIAGAAARACAGAGTGRYHVGGPERVSRHELGLRTAAVLGLDASGIEPIAQAELPAGAPRPADVSLDSSRAAQDLGFAPLPLDEAIRAGRPRPDIIATA